MFDISIFKNKQGEDGVVIFAKGNTSKYFKSMSHARNCPKKSLYDKFTKTSKASECIIYKEQF